MKKVFARNLLAAAVLGLMNLSVAHAADIPTLLAEGRVDDAITSLQGKLSSTPNDAEAYNLLCRAYFALGNWDSGIPSCEKSVKLAPNVSRYHLWLGRIYGEKADRASWFTAAGLAGKVRSEFEAAVKLNPSSAEARTDLAEFYLEAPGIMGGGRDKAEEQAKALDAIDPDRAHWVRGRIAEKNKDLTTAEKEYRASIDASHGSALSWLNLALFYRNHNRLDEMEDAIRHASDVQSGHAEVLVDAAETLRRTGRNIPAAIDLLRRYLASPTVEAAPAFKAHYLLGMLLEKQGEKQQAAQEYRSALTLAKSYSAAQDALNRLNR
ncbi:MAG TPA: tetratricopeptide repeat protein [Terriglobales bacterium]|nr:tetratricopeptide repeat protein [Terriglobales bacterium]